MNIFGSHFFLRQEKGNLPEVRDLSFTACIFHSTLSVAHWSGLYLTAIQYFLYMFYYDFFLKKQGTGRKRNLEKGEGHSETWKWGGGELCAMTIFAYLKQDT